MELWEGVGLQELIQGRGRLPLGMALDVVAQVASGLHHAHTATHEGRELLVIHRDVKPSNVLLRADGVAKVVDFGIAKASIDDALSTSTGMTKGTPAYMSPEQLAADPLDARSDLFALGALLYYLLWGRTLFSGQSITEVMLRIIQVDETLAARGLFAEAEGMLPGLGDLMAQMLVKDRERRFPNALVASQAMRALQARVPVHPTTSDFVTEYLRLREAGAVFGMASDEPGDAPRVEGPRLGESDVTSDFRRRVEAAREGGVEWIESVPGAIDGPGATRLVPVQGPGSAELPPAPGPTSRPAGGLSDLSLPELPGRASWVRRQPEEGVSTTREMPSSRSRAPGSGRDRTRADADLVRQRRSARRRRMVMSSMAFAVLSVGFATWLVLGRSTAPADSAATVAKIGADAAEPSAPDAGDAVADLGIDQAPDPTPPAPVVAAAVERAPPPATSASRPAAPGAEDGLAAEDPLVDEGEEGAAEVAEVGRADRSLAGASGGESSRRAESDPSRAKIVAGIETDDASLFSEDGVAAADEAAAADEDEPASERAKAGPRPTLRIAPVGIPLRMSHRPFTMATVGTSKTIRVYAAGPDDPVVVVHFGPKGAPDRQLTLTKAGTGVWEGLIPITADMRDAGGLVYWVIITHPATTPRRLQSGSPEGPHRVTVY
jgi:hypothetical protein